MTVRRDRPASTHPVVLELLLRSWLDFLPAPRSSTPRPPSEGSPWSPELWVKCDTCKGRGETKRGKHWLRCKGCGGRGSWRVDAYDAAGRPFEPDRPRSLSLQELERLCAPLDPFLRAEPMGATELGAAVGRREPPADRAPLLDALERDQANRQEPASWRALAAALLELRRTRPAAAAALSLAYLLELEPAGHRSTAALLELAALLPRGWRAPGWARDAAADRIAACAEEARRRNGSGRWADPDARRVRDRLIVSMSGKGRSARQIARHLEVDHSTVVRVLRREVSG